MTGYRPSAMVVLAVALALGGAGAALADDQVVVVRGGEPPNTPKSWSWELRDGKRVQRGERVDNPDGSWRETIRVGSCITVKEQSAAAEYRERRRCD